MNISGAIKQLQDIMEVHGDLPVTQIDDGRLITAEIKATNTDRLYLDSNETGKTGNVVVVTNWAV